MATSETAGAGSQLQFSTKPSEPEKGTEWKRGDGQWRKWDGKKWRPACRDCPPGEKRGTRYRDEDGRANTLCAACARAAGTHAVLNPCRDCPEGAKVKAHYKDADGRPNRLCAACARAAGSYELLNPCRDCPEGAKVDAHYKDEDGRPNKLCAACAKAAGSYELLSSSSRGTVGR